MTTKQRSRNENALSRLDAQLKSGLKPAKVNGRTTSATVELTEGDKSRIKREMAVVTKSLS